MRTFTLALCFALPALVVAPDAHAGTITSVLTEVSYVCSTNAYGIFGGNPIEVYDEDGAFSGAVLVSGTPISRGVECMVHDGYDGTALLQNDDIALGDSEASGTVDVTYATGFTNGMVTLRGGYEADVHASYFDPSLVPWETDPYPVYPPIEAYRVYVPSGFNAATTTGFAAVFTLDAPATFDLSWTDASGNVEYSFTNKQTFQQVRATMDTATGVFSVSLAAGSYAFAIYGSFSATGEAATGGVTASGGYAVDAEWTITFASNPPPPPPTSTLTLLDLLIADVQAAGLHHGITQSFLAKLFAARSILTDADATNDGSARSPITSFISEMQALRGKKVDVAAADDFIAQAQALLASLP